MIDLTCWSETLVCMWLVIQLYLYWLYVLITSHAHFRVNPHSIFSQMSRNSHTHNHLVHKQTLFVGSSPVAATVSLFFYSYKKGKQVFGGWWSFVIFRKKLKPCFCLNMDPKRGIYHYHFTMKVLTFFFSNTA